MYSVVLKVKCAYPAAVGSSSSSLICDSLQRLVYHSLQNHIYKQVFFHEAGYGRSLAKNAARKTPNGGRRQIKENPLIFNICCHRGPGLRTSVVMLQWAQPLSQTDILLLLTKSLVALHEDMPHVLVSQLPCSFFLQKVFMLFICTVWLVKNDAERRDGSFLKLAHSKKLKAW